MLLKEAANGWLLFRCTVSLCFCIFNQAIKELMENAANEGIRKECIETACRMLQKGVFSEDLIAQISKSSLEEVKALTIETV